MLLQSVVFVLLGHSYSRTFFSRTVPVPAALHEDERPAVVKLSNNNDVTTTASVSGENDTSEPLSNSPASAGNLPRGGQSRRASREGRGRSNWNQRNGYRKPAGENPTAQQPKSDAAVVKTRTNSVGNSPTPLSERPGSTTKHEPPLPQRNHQRSTYRKDDPPQPANSAPSIESNET